MLFRKFLLAESKEITQDDLKRLERYFTQVFKSLGLEVDFSRHFLDRVNDARNSKPITLPELINLFNKEYAIYGTKIARISIEQEAVMRDASTEINVPFVIKWNPRTKMLILRSKTIMRKKVFHSPDPVFVVR